MPKNEHLYQPNDYLAPAYVLNDGSTKIFFVGGRAIGKTFNIITYLIEHDIMFLLVRSYDDEFKVSCTDAMNPFVKHNRIYHWHITTKKINSYLGGIYDSTDEDNPILLGYISSLTSIGHIRGWTGLDDVQVIFYDEFIQLKGQKRIPGQGQKVRDLYETVNRNRELEGQKPVKIIFASNANTINNDVLVEYGCINPIMKMVRSGQEYKKIGDLTLVYPMFSEISEKKSKTANYNGNSKYNRMAINNQFEGYYSGNVKSIKLTGSELKCIYDDMFFYITPDSHIYISYSKQGSCKLVYGDSDFETEQFTKKNRWLIDAYLDNRILFENDEIEVRFNQIFERGKK